MGVLQPTVGVWLLAVLAAPVAELPTFAVSGGPLAEEIGVGLEEELAGVVARARSATTSEFLVSIDDGGRTLEVRRNGGTLLARRSSRDGATLQPRACVALAAEVITSAIRFRAAATAPASTPAIDSAPGPETPSEPPTVPPPPPNPPVRSEAATAVPLAPPSPPTRSAERPPLTGPQSVASTETATQATRSGAVRLALSADGRLWFAPLSPRLGLGVDVGWAEPRWRLGLRFALASGSRLETSEIAADLVEVHALAVGAVSAWASSGWTFAPELGVGAGVFVGSVGAVEPAFASAGQTSSTVRVEPVLIPGLEVSRRVAKNGAIFARIAVKLAFVVHRYELPSGLGEPTQSPVSTPPVSPWLSVGFRYLIR